MKRTSMSRVLLSGHWGIKQMFRFCAVAVLATFLTGLVQPALCQMVDGTNIPEFGQTFGVNVKQKGMAFSSGLIESNIPANILWPKDSASFTVQIKNVSDKSIQVKGKIDIIEYGTKGRPGDVWVPLMFKIADIGSIPLDIDIPSNGFKNFTINPAIPEKFGTYALVVDLGSFGRQFLVSCSRTFAANPERLQYPAMSLDDIGSDVLSRLGIQAIRCGIEYKPTTDPDFEQWFKQKGAMLEEYAKHNITILFMVGGGAFTGPTQPLSRPRPWLDSNGTMQDTKFDLAWLPSYDADFAKYCKLFVAKYGWPRGPVTAFSLWNEPWEGISISGWGADMLRYREMYMTMARAVHEANKTDSVNVLVGGGDSHTNAFDKFFPDGSDSLLPYFDFVSLHYQGMNSPSTFKPWLNRKAPSGRVKNWDTESWVANVDDRVAAVIAINRACGYDRAMGVYGGNVRGSDEFSMTLPDGTVKRTRSTNAWSVAAAVGAAQHFIGERPFSELLFKNGLPWVMVFEGNKDAKGKTKVDDGTVVVVGDLADVCGADNLLFRTARGLVENAHKAELKKQRAELSSATDATTNKKRDSLTIALSSAEILSGANMTIAASGKVFNLYDFYGNPIETKNGKIVIPLDGRGFFLRTDGSKGSFAKLTKALKTAQIDGIEPLATVCHDMTGRIEQKPSIRLSLTNVLNRPVSGTLTVKLGELTLDKSTQKISFKANETKEVLVTISGGKSVPNNTYALELEYDAGKDGKAVHEENMHVNIIAKQTIAIDGKLDEWKDVPPQTIIANSKSSVSLTEFAWFSFKKFDESIKKGFSNGYLAYDKDNFYFAAKVADNTADVGTWRFEKRNDDDFFYPETSFAKANPNVGVSQFSVRWSGILTPGISGKYTFTTVSDDGIRMIINKQTLINNWTDHPPTENTGVIDLVKGQKYNIVIEFFQGGGGSTAQLFWQTAGLKNEIVPTTALSPDGKGKVTGLKAEYFRGVDLKKLVVSRIDKTVNFDWNDGKIPDAAFVAATPTIDTLIWPKGVRRYSYRKENDLPSGNFPNFDNIQIAFNVLSQEQKQWELNPPGTMPKFTPYQTTDYEYALNQVDPKHGGGTEIWRLEYPGMPHKQFYARQPKSPLEGAVKNGKLAIVRDSTTRYVEASIPWSELPDVKKLLDAGKTIKFSYRVNDNGGGGIMELAYKRSVAKRGMAFHVDWAEHWDNEVEFAFEK